MNTQKTTSGSIIGAVFPQLFCPKYRRHDDMHFCPCLLVDIDLCTLIAAQLEDFWRPCAIFYRVWEVSFNLNFNASNGLSEEGMIIILVVFILCLCSEISISCYKNLLFLLYYEKEPFVFEVKAKGSFGLLDAGWLSLQGTPPYLSSRGKRSNFTLNFQFYGTACFNLKSWKWCYKFYSFDKLLFEKLLKKKVSQMLSMNVYGTQLIWFF